MQSKIHQMQDPYKDLKYNITSNSVAANTATADDQAQMRPTDSQDSYPRQIAVKGPPRELDDPHAHIANTMPTYQLGP